MSSYQDNADRLREINEAFDRFPWLAIYLCRTHLTELHIEPADPSILESVPDTYAHVEVVYLLDKDGQFIGETGLERRVLPDQVWRANPETELHAFHENIGDSAIREGKFRDVSYALFIQDSVQARLYHAPNGNSLTRYALEVAKKRR